HRDALGHRGFTYVAGRAVVVHDRQRGRISELQERPRHAHVDVRAIEENAVAAAVAAVLRAHAELADFIDVVGRVWGGRVRVVAPTHLVPRATVTRDRVIELLRP